MPQVVSRSFVLLLLGIALLLILVLLTTSAGAHSTDSPAGTVEIEYPGTLLNLALHGAILR